jgi:hypothetical protein
MEPWRAVDAHIGGIEAQNGALRGGGGGGVYICTSGRRVQSL